MQIARAAIALSLLVGGTASAKADCAGEIRTALQARLKALPLRETLVVTGDGAVSTTVLELETLQRLHLVLTETGADAGPAIEQIMRDDKGWSNEGGHWVPFAQAAITANGYVASEEALAGELVADASAACPGQVFHDGRMTTSYQLTRDANPSSDAPFASLQLYVDPASGLPVSFETTLPGNFTPVHSVWTMVYDPSIKVDPPAGAN